MKAFLLVSILFISKAHSQISLTTLSQFQEVRFVAVVQPEKIAFADFWKVRVIDLWKGEKLSDKFFYTRLLPKEAEGKVFIGTYATALYLGDHLLNLIKTTYNQSRSESFQELNKTLSKEEKKALYLHPFHDWDSWLIFKEKGESYVSACIDGFTKEPLINPPLRKLKDLSLSKINLKPKTELHGVFYPGGLTDDFNGLRCGATGFDKFLYFIKSSLFR